MRIIVSMGVADTAKLREMKQKIGCFVVREATKVKAMEIILSFNLTNKMINR